MTEPKKKKNKKSIKHFKPGNQLWKTRARTGANPLYDDPEKLWADCVSYFEELHNNPLIETKAFSNNGEVTYAYLPKIRAFTRKGLFLYIGIHHSTWDAWKLDREDLQSVIEHVEDVIFTQKFEAAAAGLLNSSFISVELGMQNKILHGSDPDNPLPNQVVQYQLPSNGRD